MRALAVLAFGVAAALATVPAAMPSTEASSAPRVRLVSPAPVTLRGLNFGPLERVRLAVTLGEKKAVRGLRATHAGSFTAKFRTFAYDRCSGSLLVKATGSEGSRVSWELTPLECPDDRSP